MAGLIVLGAQAAEILMSVESNRALVAEGMVPGTSCTVEYTTNLLDGFTNSSSLFGDLSADRNGKIRADIPLPAYATLFFRAKGTPAVLPAGMVRIPEGTNGGTDPDVGAYTLTVDSFYMDQYEVTKALWDDVYNWAVTNGYSFDNSGSGKAPNHPVQMVNWHDCLKWCNARSEKESRTPCYTVSSAVYKTGRSVPDCNMDANGYRLPAVDEWEYAGRGGLSGNRFPWGNTITHSNANYQSSTYYNYDINPTQGYHPDYEDGIEPYTSPVGDFAANAYGLYDMAGNVYEWCWSESGATRNLRGGSWQGYAANAIFDYFYTLTPVSARNTAGFRTVCR